MGSQLREKKGRVKVKGWKFLKVMTFRVEAKITLMQDNMYSKKRI